MNKATKNGTGSGGDERNVVYTRSVRSTSNPPKASSNANLPEKASDNESSSRSKLSTTTAKQHPRQSNIKSKLRSPVKIVGSGGPTNRLIRHNIITANKEIKKNIRPIKLKAQMTKMKQETESSEKKQKTLIVQSDNKESTEQVESKEQKKESNDSESSSSQQENGNSNGLNGKEETSDQNSNQNEIKENGKSEENGKDVSDTNEKEEECDLHLEVDDKQEENVPKDSEEIRQENVAQNESKTSSQDGQENSHTDTESYSVDVVESTTSEMSEATESTAPSENKDKDSENQDANHDAISYDSSIMLKDVKIKLNDCLKEKSEENNADQSRPEYAHKDATFGKTLRKISGRNSIGRMRHITLRDRESSPNSSLFVNTSNISLAEEGSSSDYKILRHRTAYSQLTSSNGGTPLDRKRKLIEESPNVLKKPKIEENNSLLNSSFDLLKYPFSGLRRPQISTPYKFEFEKHDVSLSTEVKADEPKKWCVIM